MRTHELRTWPEPYQAVIDGTKTHEYRRADRTFTVGDILVLREWDPKKAGQTGYDLAAYTGRECRVVVTYVTHGGGLFGFPEGFVAMSIRPEVP